MGASKVVAGNGLQLHQSTDVLPPSDAQQQADQTSRLTWERP
jgi:hypothetical protein